MDFRILGRTGLRVSRLGLGTATFGREVDEEQSHLILSRARENGINFFVSAESYSAGGAEYILGRWLKMLGDRREDIILASKCFQATSADQMTEACEKSLCRLGVDCLDIYQLHQWQPHFVVDEILEGFSRLVASGKICHAGVSNWPAAVFTSFPAAAREIEVIELRLNWADPAARQDLVPLCHRANLGIVSYGALASGFLTGKYHPDAELPPNTRFALAPGHCDIYFRPECWENLRLLQQVSAKLDCDSKLLAIAWVLRHEEIDSILMGARRPDQLEQFYSALELYSRLDWAAVNNLLAGTTLAF